MRQAVAIFAKPPVAGQTKSRLAAETSPEFAARLSGAMLGDIIDLALGTAADVIVYYPPGSDLKAFGDLIEGVFDIKEQVGHDLGERMYGCFAELLAGDYDRVLIVGSDCISHSVATLNSALDTLLEYDLAIQPAADGGYVLIGASVVDKAVFEEIDWGTEKVMAQTRQSLSRGTLRWAELTPSFDIDTLEDLGKLREFLVTNSRQRTETVMEQFSDA